MGLDIYSKGKCRFSIGYIAFGWMRLDCVNQILPGSWPVIEWASHGGMCLVGIEHKYADGGMQYSLCGVSKDDFVNACWELVGSYLCTHGYKALWNHLICHSDCSGKLTPRQCAALVKDLDRITPGERTADAFNRFREVVRKAAEQKETLFFR